MCAFVRMNPCICGAFCECACVRMCSCVVASQSTFCAFVRVRECVGVCVGVRVCVQRLVPVGVACDEA